LSYCSRRCAVNTTISFARCALILFTLDAHNSSCIHPRCTQFNRTHRFTRWIGISRDFPIGAICLPYPATSCSLPAVSPALFSIPRLVCLFCKTWGTFQCFSRSRFFCHLRKPWPHLQKEGGNSKKVHYFTLRSYSLHYCITNFNL
jgi:hypothetical protein